MKEVNLSLRFILELCMLAALAYGGYHLTVPMWLKIILAVLLPVAAAIVWGLFISPKATIPVNIGLGLVIEIILFGVACLLLTWSNHILLAVGLAVFYVANKSILLYIN